MITLITLITLITVRVRILMTLHMIILITLYIYIYKYIGFPVDNDWGALGIPATLRISNQYKPPILFPALITR